MILKLRNTETGLIHAPLYAGTWCGAAPDPDACAGAAEPNCPDCDSRLAALRLDTHRRKTESRRRSWGDHLRDVATNIVHARQSSDAVCGARVQHGDIVHLEPDCPGCTAITGPVDRESQTPWPRETPDGWVCDSLRCPRSLGPLPQSCSATTCRARPSAYVEARKPDGWYARQARSEAKQSAYNARRQRSAWIL